MTQDQKKTLKDSILAAIDAGQVTMKPRWHFVAKAVLLVVGIVFTGLALLYLSSFIFFMLYQTGLWFVPDFGSRGLKDFLFDFPWLLVLLAGIMVVLLQILVKKYSFSYGRPLLYSVLAILLLVILGGFALSLTPVHRALFHQARNANLPLAGGFYMQYGMPGLNSKVFQGQITDLASDGIIILTPRNEVLTVTATPDTILRSKAGFDVGDKILVVGDKNGSLIWAYGIREFDEDIEIEPPVRFRVMHGPSN